MFRGYPELKAKVAENDAKDQAAVLACVSEGIKAGEVRTDIDPVSAASSLLGGIYVLAMTWIESGFGFDIREAFVDRWDDFERMVSAKPAAKSRDSKNASRDRAAAYFPLRPASAARPKAKNARGSKPAAKKAAVKGDQAKAGAAKSAPTKAVKGAAAKAGAKKPARAGPAKNAK